MTEGRRFRKSQTFLLLALTAALLFCACGRTADAPESSVPDERGDTVLAGCGIAVTPGGKFEKTDGVYVSKDGNGLKVLFTQSDHDLSTIDPTYLKNDAGLKEISGFKSDVSNGIPYAAWRFSDASAGECAQIVTENENGKLVCVTLSGLPEGWTNEGMIESLSYAEEKDMEKKTPEPLPEKMHSKGISPITGTFIQPWLYARYTPARWEKEFELMKEMGIEFIILGDTLSLQTGEPITDKSKYVATAAYPAQNPDFQKGTDVVTPLFEYCKKYGMRLYVGMGNTPAGWPYLNSTAAGLKEVCEVYADTAEDIYNVYHEKYPDTFAGFYFVPELYNSNEFDGDYSRERYAQNLADGMRPVFERIRAISDLPFIFSPYVNMFGGGWVSKNVDNISLFWEEFLRRADFRDGDILCPQDSVGAGGNDIAGLEALTKAYRKAVDGCGKKILLWTNAEIFIQPTGKFFDNYDGYGGYWSTCTVDRMIEQFRIASPYVDRIVTFAFPHYLSPYNTTDGYINAYRHYLETGELDKEPPTPPDAFRTQKVLRDGKPALQIVWSGMYDAYGIHRVNIYKDGEFYSYRNSTRNEGSDGKKAEYPFEFTDIGFNFEEGEKAVYAFEVIDCAGNASGKVELEVDASSVPNGVKLGRIYRGTTAVTEGVRRIAEAEGKK